MTTIDDARWESLHLNHSNWVVGADLVFGLLWPHDPALCMHRALVVLVDGTWRVFAWGNMQEGPTGDWIDCGSFDSKRAAMRHARSMARLFEGLREKPDEQSNR